MDAWWTMAEGVTGSPAVSQIDDQTGNANHLTQATGAQQGADTGSINGKTALALDGADAYSTGASNNSSLSIFIGCNTTDQTILQSLFRSGAGSTTDDGFNFRINDSGGSGYLELLMSDGVDRATLSTASGTVAAATDYIFEVHIDGTNDVTFGINGSLTTVSTTRAATGTDAIVAFAFDTSGTSGINGEFRMGGIVSPKLSTENAALVRAFMANDMGVALP